MSQSNVATVPTQVDIVKLLEMQRQLTEQIKAALGPLAGEATRKQSNGAKHVKDVAEKSGLETALRTYAEKVNKDALKDASIVTSPVSGQCGQRGGSTTIFAVKVGDVTYRVAAGW